MATKIKATEEFWSGGATIAVPVQLVSGAIRADDGDGWVHRVHVSRDNARELAQRLASLGFRPASRCEAKPESEPEKPKGIGDVSELEYLRVLLFELTKR